MSFIRILTSIFLFVFCILKNANAYELLCNQGDLNKNLYFIYLEKDIEYYNGVDLSKYVLGSSTLISLEINEELKTIYLSGPYNQPSHYLDNKIYSDSDDENRIYTTSIRWDKNFIEFDDFKYDKVGKFFSYTNGNLILYWECELKRIF